MTASVSELVDQLSSPEFNERAKALAALVTQGSAVVPALTAALGATDEAVRSQVAQALAEIADPSSADALAAAAQDANPNVRAQAAIGLARLRDPRAVDALVAAIDDEPDALHYPYTTAVYGLIELGPTVLRTVAPLLSSPAPTTRHRAFIVVRSIVSAMDGAADWDALWSELGRYDPDAATADRDAASEQWTDWIERTAPE
jgi:HEAT repeat protein